MRFLSKKLKRKHDEIILKEILHDLKQDHDKKKQEEITKLQQQLERLTK